ncbi:unnamed protein product [Cylindrotheca closterium]|uniref:Uncharacterized protein n=1 Tax=Cylindrotheca closterium TaxID=2856 RepID=A0AAD2CJ65_9STRA|nr:unnamed protein product [Cylindrotheca closterium]
MAAARIAWRNYIRDVLNFFQDEAQETVIEQGFSSPAFFARSTRKNIDSLVKQINRTVIDPGNDPDTTFSINQAQKIMLYDLCDYCRFIIWWIANMIQLLGHKQIWQKSIAIIPT